MSLDLPGSAAESLHDHARNRSAVLLHQSPQEVKPEAPRWDDDPQGRVELLDGGGRQTIDLRQQPLLGGERPTANDDLRRLRAGHHHRIACISSDEL